MPQHSETFCEHWWFVPQYLFATFGWGDWDSQASDPCWNGNSPVQSLQRRWTIGMKTLVFENMVGWARRISPKLKWKGWYPTRCSFWIRGGCHRDAHGSQRTNHHINFIVGRPWMTSDQIIVFAFSLGGGPMWQVKLSQKKDSACFHGMELWNQRRCVSSFGGTWCLDEPSRNVFAGMAKNYHCMIDADVIPFVISARMLSNPKK